MMKKILACFLSGILLGLSQPFYLKFFSFDIAFLNNYFGLLALFAYVPWWLSLRSCNLKNTFWLSVLAGTCQYIIVLYWIFIALHDHGDVNSLLSALITFLPPLVMGFENGIFFAIAKHISNRLNLSFFLIAPLALVSLEIFRNYYLLGGFPWGNTGYSIGRIDEILQLASLIGVYGLVFVVGITNSIISYAAQNFKNQKVFIKSLFSLVLILTVIFLFGFLRINRDINYEKFVKIALLQGNIPQSIKSSQRVHAKEVLDTYFALNKEAIDSGAELTVWPESSYPKLLKQELYSFDFLKEQQVSSIIGATAYGFDDKDKEGYHYHNSAFLVDFKDQVISRYDKSHLVPFGEYVPWPFQNIVQKVVPDMGAFKPGTAYKSVNLSLSLEKNIRVGTTVCYEGIFPEISRAYAKDKAEVLVNITNDAWYGFSSAPYQHLLMYRLRSAETGLPYVRATNSGISALIDRFGVIQAKTNLFETEVLVGEVGLLNKTTIYVLIGDLLAQIITFLFFLLFIWCSIEFKKVKINLKLFLSILFLFLGFFAQIYFGQEKFIIDESAKTKSLIISIYCSIIALGFLSLTPRVTKTLRISGFILAVISFSLVFIEGIQFLFGLILGLILIFWSFRR